MEHDHTTLTLHDTVARMSTPEEIALMSDAQAVMRIDDLRDHARRADALGRTEVAMACLGNACEISLSSFVCADVLAEYADFLCEQGLADTAQQYRDYHEMLTEMLSAHGLPVPGYEDRLRQQNAERAQVLPFKSAGDKGRESLAEAASQARSASEGLGDAHARSPLPSPTREG